MKKYNFKELLKDYKVIIPAMQRDYAQGRRGKENLREVFLLDLKKSIDNDSNIELNIIFGYTKNDDTFIPIDGQQRLTTLWLIYWYVAFRAQKLKDEKEILEKFSYGIRDRDKLFCQKLLTLEYPQKQLNSNSRKFSIVDYIKNQYWFMNDWIQDPTIQSMLRMIGGDNEYSNIKNDCIEKVFSDVDEEVFKDYYNKIYGDNDCCISFQLECNDGLNSDTYVKMNARGINLTDYEKLKADFIGKVENISINGKSFCQYLDGEWLDLVWNFFKNNEEKPKNTDKLLYRWLNEMHFIYKLVFDDTCKDKDLKRFYENEITKKTDEVYYESYNLYSLGNNKYEEFSQMIYIYMYYMSKLQSKLANDVNKLIIPSWEKDKDIDYIYFGKIEYDKSGKLNDVTYLNLDERFKIIGMIVFFYKIYGHQVDISIIERWIEIWMTFTIDYIENEHISSFEEFVRAVKNYKELSKVVLSEELLNSQFEINKFSTLVVESYENNVKNIDTRNNNPQYIKYKCIKNCPNLYDIIFGDDGLEYEKFFKGNLNLFLKIKDSNDSNDLESKIVNRTSIFKGLFVNDQSASYVNTYHRLGKDHRILKAILASYLKFETLSNVKTFPILGVDHSYNCMLKFLSENDEFDNILKIVDETKDDIDTFINNLEKFIEENCDSNLKKVINNNNLYEFVDKWNNLPKNTANIRTHNDKIYLHIKYSQSDDKRLEIL